MEIKINSPIETIEKIPTLELNKYFINKVAKVKYDSLRSRSKAPTFALTYQGTATTLEKNCGFSPKVAQQVYDNYHTLYATSTEWTQAKINEASKNGYATAAFGLRIRCPLLGKTILGTRVTLNQAAAEARTLGNAISGQSYGLLNGRASVELMRKVRNHPKMRMCIKQCAHIHDAQYFYVKDDLEAIEWLNHELPKAMRWQDLPELKHDRITLPAELDIFYPTWADGFQLENDMTQAEIAEVCRAIAQKRKESKNG